MKKEGKKPVNKNTVILIISALLIIISAVIALFAIKDTGFLKKNSDNKPAAAASAKADGKKKTDKSASSDKSEKKSDDKSKTDGETEADSTEDSNTGSASEKPYVFETGKYRVATKNDPLGLRLEPNTDAARSLYIDKGEEVEVIAVWYDWGYVVYNHTGGWLSMNYLEAVSDTVTNTTEAASAEE